MTEFLDPALFHSVTPIQAFQWILIVRRRVLRAFYSSLRKKEAPLNLIETLKNFQSQDNKG